MRIDRTRTQFESALFFSEICMRCTYQPLLSTENADYNFRVISWISRCLEGAIVVTRGVSGRGSQVLFIGKILRSHDPRIHSPKTSTFKSEATTKRVACFEAFKSLIIKKSFRY